MVGSFVPTILIYLQELEVRTGNLRSNIKTFIFLSI